MIKRLQEQASVWLQYLLAATCIITLLTLLSKLQLNLQNQETTDQRLGCEKIVQPKATISREQLAKLLSIPERSQRNIVQEILKQPYCQLPSLSIRTGAKTERDVYPLAFDPQTSLIVLYEGKSYVGYGFKHN